MVNHTQAQWNNAFGDIGAAVRAKLAFTRWTDDEDPDSITKMVENARVRITNAVTLEQEYLNSIITSIRSVGTSLDGGRQVTKTSLDGYMRGRLRDFLPAVGRTINEVLEELAEQMTEDGQTILGNKGICANHEADQDNTGDVFLLVDSGDSDGDLNDWDLDGFGPENTDSGLIYGRMEFVSPLVIISLYSDSARTILIGMGSAAGLSGTMPIVEVSPKGVSGSVVYDYSTDLLFTVRTPVLSQLARPDDKIDIICLQDTVGAETWSVKSKVIGVLGQATTGVLFDTLAAERAGISFMLGLDNVSNRYVITNDDLSQLSNPLLAGFTALNTDSGILYARLEFVSPLFRVQLYRDAGFADADLVAEGSIALPSGTVALAEQNASGLSGTIDLAFAANDIDITIEVPKAEVGDKFSLIIDVGEQGRYMQCFRDDYNFELPSVIDGSHTIDEALSE